VTETASMEECNGTNLKPIPPILFFNKRMKIGDVLVQYSIGTAGMRDCGVLVLRLD
jgi:hypothetical protein